MKIFISILIATLMIGCVYDPPMKGKEIFVENQTDDFIYLMDSLPLNGRPILYDTYFVNNRKYIGRVGNYIPQFSKWAYFLPDIKYDYYKGKHQDSIKFYFIRKENCNKSYEEIRQQKLYTFTYISIKDIENNRLNYIFYYPNNLIIDHVYNIH